MVKKSEEKLSKGTKIAIEQIRERFGEGAIMNLGEIRSSNIDTSCYIIYSRLYPIHGY